jgi:rRNA maturation RNase YbeY
MNKTIDFESSIDFSLTGKESYIIWIEKVIKQLGFSYTEINYHFCSDEELLKINQEYLAHNTFTDIITFDHSFNKTIQADIHISIERVRENASDLAVGFEQELKRVIIHGILHCCGFSDKTEEEKSNMRKKEDECLKMFHVEQKEIK